jgi:hypothetical protein
MNFFLEFLFGYIIAGLCVVILALHFDKSLTRRDKSEVKLLWCIWPVYIVSKLFLFGDKLLDQFVGWMLRLFVPENRR